MEKILNQEEIDALFRAAQGRDAQKPTSAPKHRSITAWNSRLAGQISKEQVRSVSLLHDGFARNLTHSLGAYLRVLFEVNLVSAEQLSYAEFLQRVPEMTYLASVRVSPFAVGAAFQMDLALAFPVIDLLLGGSGKPDESARDMTEIEEQVLESVVKLICHELEATWQPLLEVGFVFAQREQSAQILRLMLPSEKVLSLSFEIRMSQARGTLNLVLPAVASTALLRKLSQEMPAQARRPAAPGSAHLQERLRHCGFATQLVLPPTAVAARDLIELEPGHVFILQHRIGQPAVLCVSGKKMFLAQPVGVGATRGCQIQQRLSISSASPKELP